MSIATDHKVKELAAKIAHLEERVCALESLERKIIEGDEIADDLSAQYERKFGAPPHHRMKRETIERALRE